MNEREVERALSEWMKAEEVSEPTRLREQVLAIPDVQPEPVRLGLPLSPRWRLPVPARWLARGPMVSSAAVVVMLMLVLLTLPRSTPESDGAATLTVAPDGSAAFMTIGDAVAAADAGDTVLVAPGRYLERVHVREAIILRGDGAAEDVVIVSPDGPPVRSYLPASELPFAIRLEGDGAEVRNLTVEGPGSAIVVVSGSSLITNVTITHAYANSDADNDGFAWGGLAVGTGARVEVRDSLMRHSDIVVRVGGEATIEDSRLEASSIVLGGECCEWDAVGGEGMEPRTKAIVRGNTFIDPWVGVFVDQYSVARIEGNEMQGATNAAVLLRLAEPGSVVEGNTIRDGKTALMVYGFGSVPSPTIDVLDNELVGNVVGLNISGLGLEVRGNQIRDGAVGVLISDLEGGTAPTLEENAITHNERGITITGASTPVLRRNVICDNGTDLRLLGAAQPILEDNEVCSAD